jgi:hypothetical protein
MTPKQLIKNAMLVAEHMHKLSEAKQELWGHMIEEHGLVLLESELDEILIIAQRTLEKLGEIK